MRHKNLLFVTFFTLFFFQSYAQRPNQNYNKIGVSGGIVFSNINSSQVESTAGQGLTFSLETLGSFSKTIDFIYALSYFDAAIDVHTSSVSAPLQVNFDPDKTTMKLSSVQLQFLGSFNIIRHHLSVAVGPAVAIQGKFKPKNQDESSRFLWGYNNVTVNDLREISTVDFRAVAGLTAGFEPVRVSLSYVFGLTNPYSQIQQANTETANFSGNTSYVSLRGIVYF